MDEAYLETATKSVVELLQQITEKLDQLESIDKSIDFLAAAMTGMDPMDIEMGQTALGRLAIPIMRDAAQKKEKVDEKSRKSFLSSLGMHTSDIVSSTKF